MSQTISDRVYLAGPINGRTDEECSAWRTEAMTLASHKVWVNPMARDYRGREDENVSDIVTGDLSDIDQCEALLVNASMGASWGTAMEIVYARQMHKRILVIVKPGVPVSPWLRYHADAICYSVAEGVEAL